MLLIMTSLIGLNKGQILNMNTNVVTGELTKELEPLKVVFLNDKVVDHN